MMRDSAHAIAVQAPCSIFRDIFHKKLHHSNINPPKGSQPVHYHPLEDRWSLNTQFVDNLCTFQKVLMQKINACV